MSSDFTGSETLSRIAMPHESGQEAFVAAVIGRIIASSFNIDDICEAFAGEVSKLVPFDSIAIGIVDANKGVVSMVHVSGEDWTRLRTGDEVFLNTLAGTLLGEALESRSSILVQGSNRESILRRFPRLSRAFDVGFRSFMLVPLILNDVAIGGLTLRSKQWNAYTTEQLGIVERVSDQIASAVANANLHSELQRESKEREVLAEIGRIISSSLDIDEVYRRFAAVTNSLINFDLIQVCLLDQSGEFFVNAYTADPEKLQDTGQRPAQLKGSYTEHVLQSKTGVVLNVTSIEDVLEDFPLLRTNLEAGTKSILAVPLVSNDRAIGVLYFHSDSPNSYRDFDLQVASRVSAQISGALTNARPHASL